MVDFDIDNECKLKTKNFTYGFKYSRNDYLESEEYKRELVRIEGLRLPKIGSVRLPKTDLKKMQLEVARFFMNTFKGLDLSVTTISEKKYLDFVKKFGVLNAVLNSDTQDFLDKVSDMIKEDTKKASIF